MIRAAAVVVLCALPAIAQPVRSLLVLSKGGHTLAIVDPATLKVVARVPVGPDPHEVIASSDGRIAYVANTGGGRSHEINVIDLVARKALPNIDTGALIGPHGIEFAGGKVWFTAEGAKSVARYDPAVGKIDWVIGTGQDRTHMLVVSDDGKRVFTSNVDSGSVSILEQDPNRGEWAATTVAVGKGAEGVDISPDGHELWTAAAQDGTLWIVDIANKKVAATIDAKVVGANRLKFTHDGRLVLISSARTGELAIYDARSRKEVKRLELGRGAAGLLVDADDKRAFVACTPDDYVAVVDLTTFEVMKHLDAGARPDGMAWAVRP